MTSALAFRRWAVVVAAAASGLLVFVSMLIDPAPNAEGRELIRAYADNATAQGVHTNLIHYGFALFAPVAFAMVGLARGRGAWVANVAAILAVVGLTTLPGLVLADYFSVGVERVAGLDTAFRSQEEVEKLPGFLPLIVPAFFASLIALPLAAFAVWRAGFFAWWVPAVVLAGFVLPNVLPEALLGFAAMAVATLILGWALYRIEPLAWQRSAPTVAAATEAPDRVRVAGADR